MSKPGKKKAYLTKKILISQTNKAFKTASQKAMQTLGYVVVARDGWVIKEYEDGTVEKIERVEEAGKPYKLMLD